MRGVLQRVLAASVTVVEPEPAVVSSIGRGICVLVGIGRDDTIEDAKWLCNKLLSVRVWGDGDRTWARSVRDIDGEVLLVSQFTLMHVLKGNKPDFHHAMGPDAAGELFRQFVAMVAKEYRPDRVKCGAFRHLMRVNLENDGPVTLVLDTPPHGPPKAPMLKVGEAPSAEEPSTPSDPMPAAS